MFVEGFAVGTGLGQAGSCFVLAVGVVTFEDSKLRSWFVAVDMQFVLAAELVDILRKHSDQVVHNLVYRFQVPSGSAFDPLIQVVLDVHSYQELVWYALGGCIVVVEPLVAVDLLGHQVALEQVVQVQVAAADSFALQSAVLALGWD